MVFYGATSDTIGCQRVEIEYRHWSCAGQWSSPDARTAAIAVGRRRSFFSRRDSRWVPRQSFKVCLGRPTAFDSRDLARLIGRRSCGESMDTRRAFWSGLRMSGRGWTRLRLMPSIIRAESGVPFASNDLAPRVVILVARIPQSPRSHAAGGIHGFRGALAGGLAAGFASRG